MSKKRLLTAVLVGALVAIGVAVPVIAATYGKPAESGYVRMYHYVNVDDGNDNWEATGTSTVRVTYDATVDPYSVNLMLVGTCLQRKTAYTLVNPYDYGSEVVATDTAEYWVDVDVLGTATSTKTGALSIKVCNRDHLHEAWQTDESFCMTSAFSRFSGADLWLVPADAVHEDAGEYWVDLDVAIGVNQDVVPVPDSSFFYASLGLPVEWDDVFHAYDIDY